MAHFYGQIRGKNESMVSRTGTKTSGMWDCLQDRWF